MIVMMEDIKNSLLPIGSVVLLKGGIKKVMIIGFAPKVANQEDGKQREDMWDYSGCIYPEGLLSSDQILVFDHTQITEVFNVGYEDDEEKKFKKKLMEYLNNINKDEEPKAEKTKRTKTTTKKNEE